jgi:hypothetical protein
MMEISARFDWSAGFPASVTGGHAIPMLTHHTALLVLGFLEARQPSFA